MSTPVAVFLRHAVTEQELGNHDNAAKLIAAAGRAWDDEIVALLLDAQDRLPTGSG